ncbi:hypothetical protein N9I83_00550 [bacterium]|nr:hypothetical protein [bacterium]
MISYFNLIDKQTGKTVETWGLFKRNASSYVNSLSLADQTAYYYNLEALEPLDMNAHYLSEWVPTENTLINFGSLIKIKHDSMKYCIRDPMHRYCSGLIMINYDWDIKTATEITMEPYYHNGGKQEIEAMFPNQERGHRTRQLYAWQYFIRVIAKTIYSDNMTPYIDYTFGENHLEPVLSIVALTPYLNEQANIEFVDLRNWTEFTTNKLHIGEQEEAVHQWNTPKMEERRDQIAQPGHDMFKILQKEMPRAFLQDPQAITNPQNWRVNFEDWLAPEMKIYNFLRQNPKIAYGSTEMDKLTDLLCELVQDPWFFGRSFSIRKNFSDPGIQSKLPKRLAAEINTSIRKFHQWEVDHVSRRERYEPKN